MEKQTKLFPEDRQALMSFGERRERIHGKLVGFEHRQFIRNKLREHRLALQRKRTARRKDEAANGPLQRALPGVAA